MRQNFLTKMYDTYLIGGCPQGFTLQQVSDAWEAGTMYAIEVQSYNRCERDDITVPTQAQYLSTLTPAPDVKEVAVTFSQWEASWDIIQKLAPHGKADLFDYWYENIYSEVIEKTKK